MALDLVLQNIVQTETTNRSLKDSMFLISLYDMHNSIIWMYLCWKDAFCLCNYGIFALENCGQILLKRGKRYFFGKEYLHAVYCFPHSEEYNCNCKQKVFKRVYCLLSLKAMEKCRMISSILFLVFSKYVLPLELTRKLYRTIHGAVRYTIVKTSPVNPTA